MSQAIVFVQQLVDLFACRRRNSIRTYRTFPPGKEVAGSVNEIAKERASRGYSSSRSTDPVSDTATICTGGSEKAQINPYSYRFAQVLTKDGAIALCLASYSIIVFFEMYLEIRLLPEARSSSLLLAVVVFFTLIWSHAEKASSGFSLDDPARQKKHFARGEQTNANAHRKPLVQKSASKSSHAPKCTLSSGSDVPSSLEDALKRQPRCGQSASPKNHLPAGLQEVLGKLTPADATIVKDALEAKLAASRTINVPLSSHVANAAGENTFHLNLQKLANIDSKRVFMVRRLGKLGFKSPELLKSHFSKFGTVDDVLVSHQIEKSSSVDPYDPQATPNARPAGVGFIVMERADDVVSIFKQGLEHTISGVSIALTAYEHHDPTDVMRNEVKFGLPPASDNAMRPRGPRFPTYANLREDNTMKANWRKIVQFDAKRIFVVRKINKLGLGSSQLLKTHFGQFGCVTDVFVTPSIYRGRGRDDQEDASARPLVRPAGFGFVVMEKPEDVASIFEHGEEHILYGVKFRVATYEHQIPEEATTQEVDILSGSHEASMS